MEQTTKTGDKRCKCGFPARHGQRYCKKCHSDYEKRRRLKLKGDELRLKKALEQLTLRNRATETAFKEKLDTRDVVILGPDGVPEISGLVVGFLPDRMLKILDDDGNTHVVSLSSVQADFGRIKRKAVEPDEHGLR